MFVVYILLSERDGRYYYGSTADLNKRLKAYNAGRVRSTRHRRPLILHYTENCETKAEAIKRERFFKSLLGNIWLNGAGKTKYSVRELTFFEAELIIRSDYR